MKEYCVQRIELFAQDIFIKAETPEQALKLVDEGKGIEGELHYNYTLSPKQWKVYEIK